MGVWIDEGGGGVVAMIASGEDLGRSKCSKRRKWLCADCVKRVKCGCCEVMRGRREES